MFVFLFLFDFFSDSLMKHDSTRSEWLSGGLVCIVAFEKFMQISLMSF